MGRGKLAKTFKGDTGSYEVKYHTPVLLQEVIKILDPKPGKEFIDATIGGGGHTFELLRYGARVLGIDRDPEALDYVNKKCQMSNVKYQIGEDLILAQGNFANIGRVAKDNEFSQVNGIIFDLGVSGHQIEKVERGFSFTKEGPLDMRMDPGLTVRAYDIVNNFDKRRLDEIFKTYGQEKHSWAISKAIVSAREIKPIETTFELADIVKKALLNRGERRKINPATKAFQALRIVVNSELLNLEETLPQTVELLKKGGRLATISFHSLEDRIVKRFFKQETRLKVLTKKPIGPGNQEVLDNPRARSAKLRAAEKI